VRTNLQGGVIRYPYIDPLIGGETSQENEGEKKERKITVADPPEDGRMMPTGDLRVPSLYVSRWTCAYERLVGILLKSPVSGSGLGCGAVGAAKAG
jgi:hypothetical protein